MSKLCQICGSNSAKAETIDGRPVCLMCLSGQMDRPDEITRLRAEVARLTEERDAYREKYANELVRPDEDVQRIEKVESQFGDMDRTIMELTDQLAAEQAAREELRKVIGDSYPKHHGRYLYDQKTEEVEYENPCRCEMCNALAATPAAALHAKLLEAFNEGHETGGKSSPIDWRSDAAADWLASKTRAQLTEGRA